MDLGLGTFLGSGLSLIGGLRANQINRQIAQENMANQRLMNDQNIAFQREANAQNIAFQQAENKITREREDNAIMRASIDMQNAGLSKTLAAGNPASAQSLAAPQVSAPEAKAIQNQFKYESALQKLDLANVLQKMISETKANERADKLNDANVRKIESEIANIDAHTTETNNSNKYYEGDHALDVQIKTAEAKGKDLANERSEIENKHLDEHLCAQIRKLIAEEGLTKEQTLTELSKSFNLDSQSRYYASLYAQNVQETKAIEYNLAYAKEHNKPYNYNFATADASSISAANSAANHQLSVLTGLLDSIGKYALLYNYGGNASFKFLM